jgi:hypothetical protein
MSTRRVTLVLLFGFMEACLITPILVALPAALQALGRPVALRPAALGAVWLVLCAMAGTRRLLAMREAGLGVQRAVLGLWLLGLAGAFIALTAAQRGIASVGPLQVVAPFTGAVLVWWRGAALG